jgi:transposase-like protein
MTTLPKNIDHPCYHDDTAARIALEAIFWPSGPSCPKCGKIDTVSEYGKSMGPGWYWCTPCREKFTVRVGTVLERSHIALHKWMLGFRLYTASKKGFSAHQLMRTIGLGSYRSAWFMAHRIREAMDGSADSDGPLGGEGKVIEADETFYGTSKPAEWVFVNDYGWVRTKRREQMKIMTLVERGGRARSVKVENLTSDSLRAALVTNASRKSALHTDEFTAYIAPGREFAEHETVNHKAKEYVRKGRRGQAHTPIAFANKLSGDPYLVPDWFTGKRAAVNRLQETPLDKAWRKIRGDLFALAAYAISIRIFIATGAAAMPLPHRPRLLSLPKSNPRKRRRRRARGKPQRPPPASPP